MQLHTVRPNGQDLRQITSVEGDAINPDWSPDGRTIVFELGTEENANVAFIPADGGPIRVVPAPPGTFEGQPSYMPDGRHILFTQFNGEEEATWIMKLDGSDRRRITAGPGDATDPNAAPDGREFSYVGVHDHNWEIEQALVKSSLDGSRQLQLMPFDVEVGIKHDWAPDGSRSRVHQQRRLRAPGRVGERRHDPPRRTGTPLPDALHGRRGQRLRRRLLPERAPDRVPLRGPRDVRAR